MSPPAQVRDGEVRGFPRVSGDEPVAVLALGYNGGFSPRERG